MSLVYSSAPYRLSIAGGGTDLPAVWPLIGANILVVSLKERVRVS